ncbi:tetratricopeptide repeat protein [Mucilaginibacter sp. RS28]|uniref:Tetratricopeptide repeat protein n=1 Tax=Mucilaginibacter straminoryzae TaxID=2932774 RepID=A0A9X1X1G1_9SPHI|nr:tetratricopeptide repeat protein [Mucilaginibacter straminoryzae]MCJ8209442.1 tetratricopeptide repeat protein [Mucilaginibacter straminoryzae]
MLTNQARLIIAGIFVLMLAFFVYEQVYQLAGVALMFSALLIWGYFKEGPIVIAAKHFHDKNYDKAEQLLKTINKPDLLSKKRRGFYEFMMGGINLQRQDYDAAERHYEVAAQYPLRSVNDHVAALAHVANISIRQHNYEKAGVYLVLAHKHYDKTTAKMKSVLERLDKELKNHQTK